MVQIFLYVSKQLILVCIPRSNACEQTGGVRHRIVKRGVSCRRQMGHRLTPSGEILPPDEILSHPHRHS